jgi:hypothetical protein
MSNNFSVNIFLLSLFGYLVSNVSGNCISINNLETTQLLNVTYHEKCYKHTIEQENCCQYFLLNEECKNIYLECVHYEDYVLNNIMSQCHSYNKTLNEVNYSNKCHHFTLHLEPFCCDDLNNEDCFDWYTQCISHDKNETKECNIPTKYTNQFCADYTKHIDENCCHDFTDICSQIYQWCYSNHQNETSILDLFLAPKKGYTIGSNLKIFHNIINAEDCAQLCLDTSYCRSFDYVVTRQNCYLSKHVIGDVISSDITVELIGRDNIEAYYYELIFKMPHENTLCNIKNPSWIGDGICERRGGYNTEQCGWDGGDCCKATCDLIFCGIFKFDCKDPAILYPPTNTPTKSPTTGSPTINPTNNPTYSPTPTPTNNPSEEPTSYPTDTPTYSPTGVPTLQPSNTPSNAPTKNPTGSPSLSPTTGFPTTSPSRFPTKTPTIKPTIQIIIEKSSSDDSDLKQQITSMIVAISLLSFLIVMILFIFCRYKNSGTNNTYNITPSGVSAQSFSNPLYDSSIKNTKQSSNNSTSSLNSNGDNTVSSRTRSKTKRAYKSQSSFSNEEDATQLYDDVVYQEESGHGYVDEDEGEFMTSTNADGTINVYEDDVDDTYVDSDLIGGASSRKTKKSRSGSSLEFSEA